MKAASERLLQMMVAKLEFAADAGLLHNGVGCVPRFDIVNRRET